MAMRGLTMFISEIRQCNNKEEEQKRINKELGKIRSKFSQTNIGGYQLKKYVWKIIYMMMLGVEIDFGHMEAVNLISSNKYSEKNVGYVACTLMLNEQNDILRLIIQSVKNDLNSRNENTQCLALTCISNVGGEEFAESLAGDVQKLLVASSSRNFVRKKAALCLLRLFRKYPDVMQTDAWAPRIIDLLDNGNLGVCTSVMGLLLDLVSFEPAPYADAVPKCIAMLAKLHARECERSYMYYSVACPWLQIKILKLLQYFPPPKLPTLYSRLLGQLAKMIDDLSKDLGAKGKNVNRSNAGHAVLFEAINLIMHLNLQGSHDLLGRVISLLGMFVSMNETNLRYLSMESMSRLAKIPGTIQSIKSHQQTIIRLLKDNDIFLRKRALGMLFCMCDASNARQIIQELLANLANADYAIRGEMVLKIAILTENFTSDFEWYIDVVLELISVAGDFVTDDIWHRIILVVTNNEDLQARAAERVFTALCAPQVHETLVTVGGYILGEFGHLIAEDVATPMQQFEVLYTRFPICSLPTKALLLSTFMKMANLHEGLKPHVNRVFKKYKSFVNDEIQQRAVEYSSMLKFQDQNLISQVWEMMPPFPERESSLLQIINESGAIGTERAPKQAREDEEDNESSGDSSDSEDDVNEDDEDEAASQSAESASKTEDEEEESEDEEEEEDDGQESRPYKQDVVDLLDVGALAVESNQPSQFSSSSPIPSSSASEQDPMSLGKMVLSDKGAIYESSQMQIGCMLQCTESPQLKMILYIGNKNQHSPIENVVLNIPPSKGLRAEMKPAGPLSVGPKKQEAIYILFTVAQPFPPFPPSTLRYTIDGATSELQLRLPISMNKFMTNGGVVLSGPQFIEQWKQNSVESKIQLKCRHPFEIGTLKQQFAQGLHLGVLEGIDRNPNSIVAIGVLHHIGSNHQATRTPLLLRCETHQPSQMIRVTTHSKHRVVNAAIEATIKAAF